jgi:hypothetical protein
MAGAGFVKNLHQQDHEWMIQNALASYIESIRMVLDRVKNLEFESVMEFNCGSVGIFTGLIGLEDTAKQIKNYRLMDCHYQCTVDSYKRNEEARSLRPDVSYVTHVGNIWEYEDIIPVSYRYRSNVTIVYYLSNTPDDKIEDAIAEICRVTVGDIIVIDYIPDECPIDISLMMREEMTECLIHTSIYTKEGEVPANECLYHIIKPPLQ